MSEGARRARGGNRWLAGALLAVLALSSYLVLRRVNGTRGVPVSVEPAQAAERRVPARPASVEESSSAGSPAVAAEREAMISSRGAELALRVELAGGAALAGARIRLHQDGKIVRRLTCDQRGRALAGNLSPGRVGLALDPASLPAGALAPTPLYGVKPSDGGGLVCREVQLARGDRRELVLSLLPAARIEGRIFDLDGAPLADAHLIVISLDVDILRRYSQARSDASGGFAFDSLGAGQHRIQGVRTDDGRACTLPRECSLEAGESLYVELRPVRYSASVKGTLVDAGGAPFAGVMLRVQHAGLVLDAVSSDADGRFEFAALPALELQLDLDPRGFRSTGRFGLRKVATGFGTLDVDLSVGTELELGVLSAERPPVFHFRGRATPEGKKFTAFATYLFADGSEGHTIELAVEGGGFEFQCDDAVHRVRIWVRHRVPRGASTEATARERTLYEGAPDLGASLEKQVVLSGD